MNQDRRTPVRGTEQSPEHFYAMLRHEMRTPLTSLQAALDMLRSPGVGAARDQVASRLLDNMARSVARLERLTDDLSDIASARTGKLSTRRSPVELTSVIERVVDEMNYAASRKRVSVVGRWHRKRELVVVGDEGRLHQILANLLSNAINAAPERGTVRIIATRTPPDASISVANPGVRLDPHVRGMMFEPFEKSSAGGYHSGTGLGPSIVESLVHAHGGKIVVEDTGRQVRFTFTIPLWGKGTAR